MCLGETPRPAAAGPPSRSRPTALAVRYHRRASAPLSTLMVVADADVTTTPNRGAWTLTGVSLWSRTSAERPSRSPAARAGMAANRRAEPITTAANSLRIFLTSPLVLRSTVSDLVLASWGEHTVESVSGLRTRVLKGNPASTGTTVPVGLPAVRRAPLHLERRAVRMRGPRTRAKGRPPA